jgi:hypothetical protein
LGTNWHTAINKTFAEELFHKKKPPLPLCRWRFFLFQDERSALYKKHSAPDTEGHTCRLQHIPFFFQEKEAV